MEVEPLVALALPPVLGAFRRDDVPGNLRHREARTRVRQERKRASAREQRDDNGYGCCACVLTSSLISLLQGPASVSGQIRNVPPAGTLRMTLSAAAHAAVHAPAKALGRETRRRWRSVSVALGPR